MQPLASLTDDALLHELHVIVGSHRRVTAELVLHLGEVDARRLHVDKGFPSLFAYCVGMLRFSEDEACRRIEAARLTRRFPAICPLLETAAVSLTVLGLLKPHLTDDNHRALLAGVAGASVRQANEWLAARFHEPDVPSTIRKLGPRCPGPAMLRLPAVAIESTSPESLLNGAGPILGAPAPTSARQQIEPSSQERLLAAPPASARAQVEPLSQDRFLAAPPASARAQVEPLSQDRFLAASPAPARAQVEPLSQDRFLVKFTASRAMRDKLELARDLMRHANPKGELAILLERAVDLLVAELQKKRQGQTSRPQKQPRPAKDTHVTHGARREIVAREGWRCSFVADDGRRCDAKAFIEFDHPTPKGRGGGSEAENLRLLCRSHNRWAAERAYGKAHVSRAISGSRSKSVKCAEAGHKRDKILTVREPLASYPRERPRDANVMHSGNEPREHSRAGGRARRGSRVPRAFF